MSQTIPLMSSPEKKKPRPTPNTSLPDDLLLSCLARVSRLYYPTLSLVSKSFRSLIASPELYKARSLLDHTESCLYVCLKLCPSENLSWFTLVRKPDKTLTNVTVRYALAKVSIPQSPLAHENSNFVSDGSNIYKVSRFSISTLDYWSHTWREALSLRLRLNPFSACVLDQKIYVSKDDDSDSLKNTLGVFDTKTQIWDLLTIPDSEIEVDCDSKCVCFDGKLHVDTNRGVVTYDPKEDKWDLEVEPELHVFYIVFLIRFSCQIGNVLYSVIRGYLVWCDTEARMWRGVKGMVGLPNIPLDACVRLVDYGGKMAVLWDKHFPCSPLGGRSIEMKIWCAVIALEKRKRFGMWGKVEWFGHVLTVPKTCVLGKILAATV